jgi:hypothetical protein
MPALSSVRLAQPLVPESNRAPSRSRACCSYCFWRPAGNCPRVLAMLIPKAKQCRETPDGARA